VCKKKTSDRRVGNGPGKKEKEKKRGGRKGTWESGEGVRENANSKYATKGGGEVWGGVTRVDRGLYKRKRRIDRGGVKG